MIINLVGRLGRDAELKTAQNGKQFLTYSIAFDEYNYETKQNETIWFNVIDATEWSMRQVKYLTKGRMIMFCGDYKTSIYTGKNGPTIDHRLRMLNWTFVNGGSNTQQEQQTPQQSNTQQTQSVTSIEEIQQPTMSTFVRPTQNVTSEVSVETASVIDDLPF